MDRSIQKMAISQNIEELIIDSASILHPGDRFKDAFEILNIGNQVVKREQGTILICKYNTCTLYRWNRVISSVIGKVNK